MWICYKDRYGEVNYLSKEAIIHWTVDKNGEITAECTGDIYYIIRQYKDPAIAEMVFVSALQSDTFTTELPEEDKVKLYLEAQKNGEHKESNSK